MTTMIRLISARHNVLVLALFAAFAPLSAHASEAEGSVNVGLGTVNGDSADRALFGQYNDLRTRSDVLGLLGIDYFRRNDETGTSVLFQGSDLLRNNRELGLLWKKQGDWKFKADYSEGVRREPHTIRTGLIGAGSTTPEVVALSAGSGSNVNLKVKRTGLGLSIWKSIAPDLSVEVSLKSEDKEGSRIFGSGINCPSTVTVTLGCRGTTGAAVGWAVLQLPEPIDANHSQIEARLSYAGQKLRISGGYYGSFYSNRYTSLTPGIPDSLNNPLGVLLPLNTGLHDILSLPQALPPDNQAHHLDVSGIYLVTPATQVNFKLAIAQALQHQDFGSGFGEVPAGVANLGGRTHTSLTQVGINSRPSAALSLHADLRHEDKSDKTPIALYNIEGTSTYTNRRLPNTKTRGKLLANYQFSREYRGSLGVDYEAIDRGGFTSTSHVSGISALRQKTDETGVRAELRSTLSETLSGAVGVQSSRRDGSNWLRPNSGLGVTEVSDPSAAGSGLDANSIFMPSLANRHRDKLTLRADWQPSEELSLQFSAESGEDRFKSPSRQGIRDSGLSQYTVDFDYALSFRWNFNGYASLGRQKLHQSRAAGYILSFKNTNTAVGFGFTGKPIKNVEVGGNLSYVNDKNVYGQSLDVFASPESVALLAATGGLPDIVFRQTLVKLYAKYAFSKQSSARFDIVHQRSRLNDWAWGYNGVPFVYSDGTTVSQDPDQAVTLLGVSYIYQWQ